MKIEKKLKIWISDSNSLSLNHVATSEVVQSTTFLLISIASYSFLFMLSVYF